MIGRGAKTSEMRFAAYLEGLVSVIGRSHGLAVAVHRN
jgi:hypothetical protein